LLLETPENVRYDKNCQSNDRLPPTDLPQPLVRVNAFTENKGLSAEGAITFGRYLVVRKVRYSQSAPL
jgi:hypothetical protein